MNSATFSLARAEQEAPSRVALEFAELQCSLTYAELAHRASHQANTRAAPFDRAAFSLVATPEPDTLVDFFAALDVGRPVLLQHPRTPESSRAAVRSFALSQPLPPRAQLLLETSGSTATPKLVMHSVESLAAAALASAENLGWSAAGDRWLLSLPFAHVGGLSILLRCFLGRQTVVIAPLPSDPRAAQAALERFGISLVSLVPTQLARLLDDPSFRFPDNVRSVLVGGARLDPALRSRASARGVPLLSTYGMTEFCSQICTEKPQQPGSGVGPPLAGTEVRLGAGGRIQVRGPTACLGYLGQPSPFDAEGWFTTSDRGEWDERGHLHVLGRLDSMIISGGENVQPELVEAALLSLPEVRAAGVVGVPDPHWGQKIVAAVVLFPSARKMSLASLQKRWHEQLRTQLPSFALPKSYVLLEELPLLGIGKLDRAALLALLV